MRCRTPGQLQFNNLDIASDLVVGPLMRENVGVAVPRIDRFGREHVLLTEQPERYVERGMAVRQSVASGWRPRNCWQTSSRRVTTPTVMLVVTGASDAALEAAFEAEFNAIQREKWLTPQDSMRYALLDHSSGCTFRGAPCGPCLATSATWWCLWRAAAHSHVGSVADGAADERQLRLCAVCPPRLAEMPFVEGNLMEK